MTKRLFFFVLLLIVALSSAAQAAIFDPIFWDSKYFIDISELKPGMKGYGRTVVDGIKIENIDVEVIECMPNSGFDQNTFILCHVSGDLIDKTNGISGGMSGSPVYFDNRLAGAMSGAYFFTDSRTIMVTPIKHMLQVFNTQDPRFNPFKIASGHEVFDTSKINWQPTRDNKQLVDAQPVKTQYIPTSGVEINGHIYQTVAVAPNKTQAQLAKIINPQAAIFVNCAAPLCYAGLNEEEAKLVDQKIKEFNPPMITDQEVEVIPNMNVPKPSTLDINTPTVFEYHPYYVKGPSSVEPGSTLGVKYVKGFFDSYTYGTFTYIDGNHNFLGFGHPAERIGPTTGSVALAYMLVSPPNNRRNDKRGLILNEIGSWYQDRGPAVAGTLGVKPDFFPVNITVKDLDSKKEIQIPLEVIADQSTYPGYVAGAVTGGVTRTTGRYKDVIVDWQFNVKFRGIDQEFSKTNYYWFESIPNDLVNELGSFLSLASSNEFKRLIPEKVQCIGLVRKSRNLLRIQDFKLITSKVAKENKLTIKTIIETLPDKLTTVEVKDDHATLKAKDETMVLVQFLPYRSKGYWVMYPIEFYKGKAGNYQLQIFGGGKWLPDSTVIGEDAANKTRQAIMRTIDEPLLTKPMNVQDVLTARLQTPRNNELIVQTAYTDIPSKIGLTPLDQMPVNCLSFIQDGIVVGGISISIDFQSTYK